ncbi:uncharacterized protein LOC106883568 [Octopus bimaculoides]|uniref:uncharacterized protein LOC106883568 n=1 Tax=Octopus bimaculoides TaxID=37653 RepID=UPI00071D6A7D|nr:uncharacterized protein LOC106883568 [Octopus bimaculoides]|eukprot:XP_014790107.1 PREDICTED: uncharacterized protein LOC106883568 [Octopus bimaculoides]
MPTFKIQGQIYHKIEPLLPSTNETPQFLQVYYVGDYETQAARRRTISPSTSFEVILQLQETLHMHNSYVKIFKYALEFPSVPDFTVVLDAEKRPANDHSGRYNAPNCNEIAIVLGGEQHNPRRIVLSCCDQTVKRINETYRAYDALQYPLLFVRGEDDYHLGLHQRVPSRRNETSTKQVSCMQFYSYRFLLRHDCTNHLQRSCDLFHQFAVDVCAKMESERLSYIRFNQQKLRSNSYIHLRDGLSKDVSPGGLGQVRILLSSFTGGPCYMHERTQDAMTYVRYYGRLDLFITFTCNLRWWEVGIELFQGQKAKDRHDLIARVFHLKISKLMNFITKGQIFGLCAMQNGRKGIFLLLMS